MRARQEVTKSNQTFAWWHVVESAVSFPGKLCLVIWLQGNEGAGHCRKGTLLLLGNTMVNDKGKQNPTSWFIKAGQRLINSAWMHAQLFQSFPTLWDPMDCSLPRSSVLGIYTLCNILHSAGQLRSHEPREVTACPGSAPATEAWNVSFYLT